MLIRITPKDKKVAIFDKWMVVMLYDLGEFCIENCRVIGKTDAQQVAVRYDIDVCDH